MANPVSESPNSQLCASESDIKGSHQTATILNTSKAVSHMGSKAVYLQILDKFASTRAASVHAIRDALAVADLKAAKHLTHTLKGIAATIGANSLSESTRQLEIAIHQKFDKRCLQLLNTLDSEMSRVLAAIADHLASQSGPDKSMPGCVSSALKQHQSILATTKPTILIVDDVSENIEILGNLLGEQYWLRVALSGESALEQAHIEPRPELILLDIMLPGMDGYEVCRHLKSDARTCDIPVIFITAKTETDDEVLGLAHGAVDYLTKPVIPAILNARVSTHIALRRTRLELEQKNLILNDEKELLEDIVTRMNSASPFNAKGIRHIHKSLEKTAGDIVLSAYRPDGTQHVLVGDFSGHGLSAAFSGPLVSYIFYQLTKDDHNLSEILAEINRTLYRQLPIQIYMAASALELSPARNQVKIWNYGLPPVLILNEILTMERIKSGGLPLGLSEQGHHLEPHAQHDLQRTSRLYQYTDGITEARSSRNTPMYGQTRLEKLVAQIYHERLPLETVWEALAIYCSGQDLSDDALMVETSPI